MSTATTAPTAPASGTGDPVDDPTVALLAATGFIDGSPEQQRAELVAAIRHDLPEIGEPAAHRFADWAAPAFTALAESVREARADAEHARAGLDHVAAYLDVDPDTAELADAVRDIRECPPVKADRVRTARECLPIGGRS